MPRRFTDTEKWRDEWWGSLPNDYRMIWLYLVDSCSIAGIWKKDFRGLNFNCNTKITEDEFLKVFGTRVIDKGNFFFIPKFLRYQCPKGLNSNKPAILSIIKELELNDLTQTVNESLGNDFLIIKDKGKGKGTGEGKGKDKGTGTGTLKTPEPKKGKLEVFKELFEDEIYLESLAMTHRGKDIKQAFEECYIHHSNAPNPPRELSEWKQKLNTWLSNTKYNATPKDKQQSRVQSLANGVAARYGADSPFKANG